MGWRELPKSQKFTLVIVIVVLLSTAITLAVGAVNKEFQGRQNEITQIKSELNDLMLAEMELDGGKASIQLEQEKHALEQLLPPKLGALMLLKNAMANYQSERPIEFILLKPLEVEVGEIHEAKDGSAIYGPSLLPVRIKFISDYTETVRYLSYLEKQDWLLSTRNLSIKRSTESRGKLEAEVIVAISLAAGEGENQQDAVDLDLVPTVDIKREATNKSDITEIKGLMFGSMNERNVRTSPKTKLVSGGSLPFEVEGMWQKGVVVGGLLYKVGQSIKGWKIVAINVSGSEVVFAHGNSQTTVKVEQ